MSRLIINADDLGINSQRSHGILIACEQGVVTNVSLLPNGSDSEVAARRANERDIPTGLHINLTTSTPIAPSEDIETLLTTDGFFLGIDALERGIAEGMIEAVHIEREIRAQIDWFLEHRGQPTHISSHEHVHVHPFIAKIIAPMMDRYGISYVRIPSEPTTPFGYVIEKKQQDYIERISHRAEKARSLYTAHNIASTNHFRGLAYGGNATMRNLRHTLGRLPDGTIELMVHPGSSNPNGELFDRDPQRQTELSILINPDTVSELKEREVSLCSYADAL